MLLGHEGMRHAFGCFGSKVWDVFNISQQLSKKGRKGSCRKESQVDYIINEPISKRPSSANLCVGQKFQSSEYPSMPAVEISDPP
jgi:hypothetical protein